MVFCLEVKAPDLDWESEEEGELDDNVTQNKTAAAERKDKKKAGGRRDTVGDQAELEREINNEIAAWFESGLARREANHKPRLRIAPLVDTWRGSEATLVSCDTEEKEKGSPKQEDAADGSDKTEPASAEEIVVPTASETEAAANSSSPSDTVFIPCLADQLSPATRPFSVFIPTRIPALPNFSQGELDRILSLIRFKNFMAPTAAASTDDAAAGSADAQALSSASLAGPEPPPTKSAKGNINQSMPRKSSPNDKDITAVGPSRETADGKKKKNKKKKKKKAKNLPAGATVGDEPDGSCENTTPSDIDRSSVESTAKTVQNSEPVSAGPPISHLGSPSPIVDKRPTSSESVPLCEPKDENSGSNPTNSGPRSKRSHGRRGKGTSKNKSPTDPPASDSQHKQGGNLSEPNAKALVQLPAEVERIAGSTPNKKKAPQKLSGPSNKTPVSNAKENGPTVSDSPVYKLNEKLDSAKAINRYSCLGGLVDGSMPDIDPGPAGKRPGTKDSEAGGGSSRRNRKVVGKNFGNAGHPPQVSAYQNKFTTPPKPEPLNTAPAPLASGERSSAPKVSTDASKVAPSPDVLATTVTCGPGASSPQDNTPPNAESTPASRDAVSQDSGCAVSSTGDAPKADTPAAAIAAKISSNEEPPKAPAPLGWADEVELEKGEITPDVDPWKTDAPTTTNEATASESEKGLKGTESGSQQPLASMPLNAPPPGADYSSGRGTHYYNNRSSYYQNRQPNHMPQATAGYGMPSQEWGTRNGSPPHPRNENRGQYGRRYQHNGGPTQQQHVRRYYQGPPSHQGTGSQQCGQAFSPQSGPVRAGQQIPIGSAPTSPPVVQPSPGNARAQPTGAPQPVGMAAPMGQPAAQFQPGSTVGYYNTNMGGPPGPYGGANVPMHPQMMSSSQFIPHGSYHGGRYNGNRNPRSGGQRYDSYHGGGGRGAHPRSYQRYDQQQHSQQPGQHSNRGQHHQRHSGARGPYVSGANNAPMQQQQHHAHGSPVHVGSGQAVPPAPEVPNQPGESTAAHGPATPQPPPSAPPEAIASIPTAANHKPAPTKQRMMIVLDCDEEEEDIGCGGEGAGYTKLMARVLAGLQENGVRVVGCAIEDAPGAETDLAPPPGVYTQ